MTTEELRINRKVVGISALVVAGLYLALCGWVGGSDYDQAVSDQKFYCEMVADGSWPKDPSKPCPKKVAPDLDRRIVSR
jgi:hypothetical protein